MKACTASNLYLCVCHLPQCSDAIFQVQVVVMNIFNDRRSYFIILTVAKEFFALFFLRLKFTAFTVQCVIAHLKLLVRNLNIFGNENLIRIRLYVRRHTVVHLGFQLNQDSWGHIASSVLEGITRCARERSQNWSLFRLKFFQESRVLNLCSRLPISGQFIRQCCLPSVECPLLHNSFEYRVAVAVSALYLTCHESWCRFITCMLNM